MQYFYGLTLSEMGISPILLTIIISFSILFIVAFGLSSMNMDSDGINDWMMKKPDDWIGNKKATFIPDGTADTFAKKNKIVE